MADQVVYSTGRKEAKKRENPVVTSTGGGKREKGLVTKRRKVSGRKNGPCRTSPSREEGGGIPSRQKYDTTQDRKSS